MTLTIREAPEGEASKRTIAGGIKYDTDSQEMSDWYSDTFVEQIAAGAFDDSLATRGVVGLWSHDTSQVLGNTKSGTLRLSTDTQELRFELDLPATTSGNDAWETIKRGDVDGVSFGMRVTKDKWSSETREDGGKLYKRTILNAELYEISPVAFPAYLANDVACRSLDEFRAIEASGTGSSPSYGVGSRVVIAGKPHDPAHTAGEVREAVLTWTYGIVIDGMEDMGVHHWYVESELAPETEADDEEDNTGGDEDPPEESDDEMRRREMELEKRKLLIELELI